MSESTGAPASPPSSGLLADAETLEILYRLEEDPVKKQVIRRQLEEMRKEMETR